MAMGKQMQFFGARANLAKCLLYAINGGRDEISGKQVAPPTEPVTGDYLDFDDVLDRFDRMMDWLAGTYVSAMNVIHYMHDKYAYERIEMALHDYAPLRTMAFGIAGMSVVADGLSAIKYAKVKVMRDETGLIADYETKGEFPTVRQQRQPGRPSRHLAGHDLHGQAAQVPDLPERAAHPVGADHHVERGLRQGDRQHAGRAPEQGEPFAPGANPMHGRDSHGIHASAASVAKIPYRDAADGISLTTTLVPTGLGRTEEDRITNLTSILDAFFGSTGYHMNINVLNRETLLDAMDHPEKYPSLTIRVSGYAVNFVRLTREQQMDVINRTFHGEVKWPEQTVGQFAGGQEPLRDAGASRRRCPEIDVRTRSRPATWASCTASPPVRRSTVRASARWPGPPPACSAANIATTPTPGR